MIPNTSGHSEQRSSAVIIQGPAGPLCVGNDQPITFFLGMNVLESAAVIEECCAVISRIDHVLRSRSGRSRVVFKASFDKANRSSIHSARGPGFEEGISILKEIRSRWNLPILTDIHEPSQAKRVAEVADLIQIPAFLCRQTDLLQAACETGTPLHIKKMQMMAPEEMGAVLKKCAHFGQDQVILCERGTQFGYGQLIVDPLSFPLLKTFGAPVSFDVTHALQQPGKGSLTKVCAGGRGEWTLPLATAGVSQGIAALFIECHPDPPNALCDGACATPLSELECLVQKMLLLDQWIKSME